VKISKFLQILSYTEILIIVGGRVVGEMRCLNSTTHVNKWS